MFGMMMNKSRRLLRRASTRNNILNKEKEQQGLGQGIDLHEDETPHMHSRTRTSQTFPSGVSHDPPVGVGQTAIGGLNCLSEESSHNGDVIADVPRTRSLARSTSCTNIFFGNYMIGAAALGGAQLGSAHAQLDSATNLRTAHSQQGITTTADSESFGSYRTTAAKMGNIRYINSGSGNFTGIPNQFGQGQGQGCAGRDDLLNNNDNINNNNNTVSSSSVPGHCIDLRLKMTLPDRTSMDIHGATGKTSSERHASKEGALHSSVERKSELKDQYNLQNGGDNAHILDNQKNESQEKYQKQSNKTLLRSRSCSFILSLSYQLMDSGNFRSTGNQTKDFTNNGTTVDSKNSTGFTRETTREKDRNSETKPRTSSHGLVHQFRRLRKTRSLLHFAGFTKDPNSKNSNSKNSSSKKEPQTSGGRKSVIIEKDEDHFDDICGQLKPRDNDGGDDGDDENDDEFCPSTNEEAVYEHKQLHKSLGDDPNMDKQMGTEGRTRNAITNSVTKDTDRKYLIDAHNHVETTGKDKNGGNENQSECLINNKCNTEDARYKDNVADCLIGANKEMKYKDENRDKYKDIILGPEALKRPGFNEDNSDGNKDNKENEDTANAGSIDDDEEIHEAHRCIRPNCRQCQFLSQFLVPKPPPPKPLPPSRQKNTSRNPRRFRRGRFYPSVLSSPSTACSLPVLLLPQGKGGRGQLHKGRSYDTSANNIPPELALHPPRLQRQQSKSLLSPHYKKHTSFQSRLSTLTKALGIFAKRTHSMEEKTVDHGSRHNTKGDVTTKQGLLSLNTKGTEKIYPKNQRPVKEVFKTLGLPVSKSAVAPPSTKYPISEAPNHKSPSKDNHSTNNNDPLTNPQDKEETTSGLSTKTNPSPKSKTVTSSPCIKKLHRSPYRGGPVQKISQTPRILADASKVDQDGMKRDQNTYLPVHKKRSGVANYSLLPSRVGNKLDYRNNTKDSAGSYSRPKQFGLASNHEFGSKDTAHAPTNGNSKMQASLATNFTGCYSILPPIDHTSTSQSDTETDSANRIRAKH